MYTQVSFSIVVIQARDTKSLELANVHVNEKDMAGIRGTQWAKPPSISQGCGR